MTAPRLLTLLLQGKHGKLQGRGRVRQLGQSKAVLHGHGHPAGEFGVSGLQMAISPVLH